MKFAPEIVQSGKLSSSDNSRSILRVPSLATSGSNDAGSGRELPLENEYTRSNGSSYTGTPPHGRHRSPSEHRSPGGWVSSPSSYHSLMGQPPVYVNYRPEEMNIMESTRQYCTGKAMQPGPHQPNLWMHSRPLSTVHPQHVRSQVMPPYSPIRIRSGRGAHRMSINNISSSNGNHATIRSTSSGESLSNGSTIASKRLFPVSNRGKGRRNVATTIHVHSSSATDGSESLNMLAHFEERDKMEEAERSSSDLKRKLPLTSSSMGPCGNPVV